MGETNNGDLVSKQVFTTGEAAELCRVSQQTIIRCFDDGRIEGFRVPGSRFRRIPRDALLRFMRTNGIPIEALTGQTQRRVLVVDDDQAITRMFHDVLNDDEQFQIKTAATGYDAGMLTQSFQPDLLILDYMLPDINGPRVIEAVRHTPELGHIKIIVVSGVADQKQIDELVRCGADDFLQKPLDMHKLRERIHALLAT